MDNTTDPMPRLSVPDIKTIVFSLQAVLLLVTEVFIFSLGPSFFVCISQDPLQPLKCFVYELSDGQVLMVPEVIKSLTNVGLYVKSGDIMSVASRLPNMSDQAVNLLRAILGVGSAATMIKMWVVSRLRPTPKTEEKAAKKTGVQNVDFTSADFPDQWNELIRMYKIPLKLVQETADISASTLHDFLSKRRDARDKTLQNLQAAYSLLKEQYERK